MTDNRTLPVPGRSSSVEDEGDQVLMFKRNGSSPDGLHLVEKLRGHGALQKELREVDGKVQGTQQILTTPDDPFRVLKGEVIPPPINFDIWKELPTINTRLHRSISVFARNIVGLGWEIVPNFELNEDTPTAKRAEFQAEKKRVEDVLNTPNPQMPFTTIMCLMKTDQETIGNGFIEVVQDNLGNVTQLWHVEAPTIRLLKQGRGFVQSKGQQKKFFRDFGNPDAWMDIVGAVNGVMDTRTGRYVGEPDPDKQDERTPTPLLRHRATALIHFKLYSTISPHYGIPRHAPAVLAVLGNRQSARRNLAFFENDAVPRMAVLVSGGRLSTESVKQMREFFESGKSPDNAHRLIVLQPDQGGTGIELGEDKTKIELKPLTVGDTDDMSFEKYRRANDEEIRESYGLAQSFFQSEGVSRASAIVAKKITDEQEFEPERNLMEYMINHVLLTAKPFEVKLSMLRFTRPQIVDPLEQSQAAVMLTTSAVLTPNEIRRNLGMQPFPESHAFGNKPWPVAREEFRMGVALLLAMAAQTTEPLPGTDVGDALLGSRGDEDQNSSDESEEPDGETPEGDGDSDDTVSSEGGDKEVASRQVVPVARRQPQLSPQLARLVMGILGIDAERLARGEVDLSDTIIDNVMSQVFLTRPQMGVEQPSPQSK